MITAKRLQFAFLACVALTMSGCGFIAKDGPVAGSLVDQAAQTRAAQPDPANFVLLVAGPDVIQSTNAATLALAPRFGAMARGPGPDVSIGKGDILGITVFEAEAGGLFLGKEGGGRLGNYVQIPNQQVDANGQISVPYAPGPISVAGRTPREVGRQISAILAKRAIEPQVVVSTIEKHGNSVSVLGDVSQPQKLSLDPGGANLLTTIARAGGPRNMAYEETVSIQRDGVIHKAWMSSVVNDPKENVPVRSGDVIYLAREPRVFMVLGASPTPGALGGQNNRRFPFTNEKMSMAEAVSTAGGLDSERADPRQVYLFRFEKRSVLEKAGMDVARFESDLIPTVYSLDLSRGGGFFLADSLLMRDKDLIFISDAPATDLQKVLNLIGSASSSANNISQFGWYTKTK